MEYKPYPTREDVPFSSRMTLHEIWEMLDKQYPASETTSAASTDQQEPQNMIEA